VAGTERFPNCLDPFPVDAHVTVADARRRAYRDDPVFRTEVKFDIIDEAKDRAAGLDVEIAVVCGHHRDAVHRFDHNAEVRH
jgi:hypothetical protein